MQKGILQKGFLLGVLLLALTGCGRKGDPGEGGFPDSEKIFGSGETISNEEISDSGGTIDSEEFSNSGRTIDSEEFSDSGRTIDSEEIPDNGGTINSEMAPGRGENLDSRESNDEENSYDTSNREPKATLEIACIVEDLGLVSSGRKLIRDAAAKLTHDPEGQYAYVYTEPESGEEDAFYTRTLADLTAGRGPDILYISPNRLQTLQEKGVLAELTQYLSQETQDSLLPAALQMGRVEDGIYGIPTDFTLIWSLMSTRKVVSEDTWTVEQLLEQMEACQYRDNVFLYLENGASSGILLGNIILMDLENTPFIDWEKKECYFDGELFRRALRLCKACGRTGISMKEDGYEQIRQGECLGTAVTIFSIQDFSRRAEELGEDVYHYVGLPTQGGSGSFAQTNGILVINSRCEETQALTAFLEYLYSREGQSPLSETYTMSVLRFPAEDITEFYDGRKTIQNYSVVGILDEKEDGGTYAQEYAAFLDNCVPRPTKYLDVWDMIMEEAEKYLEGDKPLEEVCRVIQSRVQLYLSE